MEKMEEMVFCLRAAAAKLNWPYNTRWNRNDLPKTEWKNHLPQFAKRHNYAFPKWKELETEKSEKVAHIFV